MTFTAVEVTDGRSVKTPESPSDLNQALWEGWWPTDSPPLAPGPSDTDLHNVEAELAWLFSDSALRASFAVWYAQHGAIPPPAVTTAIVDLGGYVTLSGATAADHGTYVTVTEDPRLAAVDRGTYCAVTIAP